MYDGIVESLTHLPLLARFAIALLLFLTIPPLCKRIRLPAAVGLLLAGVVLGPSGLHIAPENGEVAYFFSDVGKLLLMFFAGLEIDLDQFLASATDHSLLDLRRLAFRCLWASWWDCSSVMDGSARY